jgi:hypothetical protein
MTLKLKIPWVHCRLELAFPRSLCAAVHQKTSFTEGFRCNSNRLFQTMKLKLAGNVTIGRRVIFTMDIFTV